DGLELNGGQPAEGGLATTAVVGPLDPGHDRDPELLPGGPVPAIQDVLLQQREERLHGRVVPGSTHATHRSDHVVSVQGVDEFPAAKLRSAIRVHDATGDVTAPGDGAVERGDSEPGLHPVADGVA